MTVRPLIAGNWKMNGFTDGIAEARQVARAVAEERPAARVAICPPATLLAALVAELAGTGVEVGGQDCHCEPAGAYTGDVSAEMLAHAGATLVILGHSERRTAYTEDDALISRKVEAALRAGLEPIVCVGETLVERRSGRAVEIVERQLLESLPRALEGRAFNVAYEPVWAIGTGHTPTTAEIEEVHAAVRRALVAGFGEAGADVPILYGGSVKGSNAAEILSAAEVGGALVGGASLKAADFLPIVRAAPG